MSFTMNKLYIGRLFFDFVSVIPLITALLKAAGPQDLIIEILFLSKIIGQATSFSLIPSAVWMLIP